MSMNIIFNGTGQDPKAYLNKDRETTGYRKADSTREVCSAGFALDISGTVTDNSAYAGHGRTAEEVMQKAGMEDITARRNYMAVMSNSVSDEDFARLQEEGFHPGSTEIDTVVTIVDKIKAALLKGGTQVVGYTDTIDGESLARITGSESFARELQKQFTEQDIPLTEENIEEAVTTYEQLSSVSNLSEDTTRYLVENQLDITPENIYFAIHAGAAGSGRTGQGYYRAGEMNGYYVKKPETVEYESLMPQIEHVIREAGLSVDEEAVSDAKWLIEKGIPFNTDNLTKLHELEEMTFPVSEEDFLKAAAIAISDGRAVRNADLTAEESLLQQAVRIEEGTKELTDRDADRILISELPFQLKNLFATHAESTGLEETTDQSSSDPLQGAGMSADRLQARRYLEEVRLSMTVSANLKLLRSGFQIETAPMEELIRRLSEAGIQVDRELTGETDPVRAQEKAGWYRDSLQAAESLRRAPAAAAAQIEAADTLEGAAQKSRAVRISMEKAGEKYEELMTAPRQDLGDSIKKAFQNVDDILADMGKELTEENRKTIRILGYNSMDMTEKNFERIRASEKLLHNITDNLRPGEVLSMIRKGINPLTMTLEDLYTYLTGQEQMPEEELASYSEFLYHLDQKKEISQEERDAYIGIYRLFRQIEKGDDAALGAVADTGREQTLENLLSAVRTAKKKHMDYQIGDEKGVAAAGGFTDSIIAQIERGFIHTRKEMQQAFAENDDPAADEQAEGTPVEGEMAGGAENFRAAAASEEEIFRYLSDNGQPITADNLLTAGELLRAPAELFKGIRGFERGAQTAGKAKKDHADRIAKEPSDEAGTDRISIEDLGEEILSGFTTQESADTAYDRLADVLSEQIERQAFENTTDILDVRYLHSLCRQVGFLRSMAKEENYTLPLQINGELTAVNLTMIHKKGAESKVTISLETEALGKNAAEFSFGKTGLTGCSISQERRAAEKLSGEAELFRQMLSEEEIQTGDIHFITEETLDPAGYALKAGSGKEKGQTDAALYRVARTYISFIRQISRKESE